MDAEQFHRAVESLGVSLSADQLKRFEAFELALYKSNEVMNLTRVPIEECWVRHFVDSLLFQDLIPSGASVLDIGTGPGFPAWPLACARPDLRVTGLDSNGKMLGFLQTQLLPNLSVVNARAEEYDRRGTFDIVTGRAVAPLSAQLEISAAFAKIGGMITPMRAPSDIDSADQINLRPLGIELRRWVERKLAGAGIVRMFPVYEKTRATERGYPRRWPEIKRKPL